MEIQQNKGNQDMDGWSLELENLPKDRDFEASAEECYPLHLSRPFSLSSPPIPDGKDYYATVRMFENGQVEALTVRVDALARMAQSRYLLAGCPIRQTREDQPEETEEERAKKDEENKNRAIRRARQQVRWKLKQISADHMITLTYRENMQDVERLKADWKAFTKLVHAKFPGWKYVAVRELQDRGAYHLHIGVHGRQDIKYLRKCWYRVLGAPVDAQGENAPGQVDVSGPAKRWRGEGSYKWKIEKLSGYLTKYLHKAFDIAEHASKRYWHSKGLKSPSPMKLWLNANNYVDAIRETFHLVLECKAEVGDFWASDGWGCVWVTG